MNLQITDREKQVIITALEKFRSIKQATIEVAPSTLANDTKNMRLYQELRQPENEYDILSAEHSLMHTLTLLARLTDKPIAHFANPQPSQDPPLAVHPTE